MEQSANDIFPVEDALEMILMFDAAGSISYANAAAREKLQYGGGLCGKHISAVFPNVFQEMGEGLEAGASFCRKPKNLLAYRKNLTCFPVEARVVSSKGSPGTYVCMANDILEKEFLSREVEQVRQEAKQALKVKSEFVANVTHELRTPVNGVLGNVRELMDAVADERTMKSLQLIERCCGDMNKIINNILDFSKLEAGKFMLEPRKFHFRDMLNYVKAQHINKITEKGLGFFMTVSPRIPEYVVGDDLRIVQILNNLLSNAQKFTAVGKITVEVLMTAQANGKLELFFIVKDTGIGIGEGDRDKLFQSFSQVDASISRKYGGTGLGLNISKQLVELMGGRIALESEKNRGSTFTFSIWLGACEGEGGNPPKPEQAQNLFEMAPAQEDGEELADVRRYGTPENLCMLQRNLSKLILCVEMENWEKAEMFMDAIRQLAEGAPQETGRQVLRLKMAIQKENYEKALTEHEALSRLVTAKMQD